MDTSTRSLVQKLEFGLILAGCAAAPMLILLYWRQRSLPLWILAFYLIVALRLRSWIIVGTIAGSFLWCCKPPLVNEDRIQEIYSIAVLAICGALIGCGIGYRFDVAARRLALHSPHARVRRRMEGPLVIEEPIDQEPMAGP